MSSEIAALTGFFVGLGTMGFGFWLVSFIEAFIFIVLVCNKRFFEPILSLFIAFLIYNFIFSINIFGYLYHNPLIVVSFVATYLVGGIPWSFFRWNQLISKKVNLYNEVKKIWLTKVKGVREEDFSDELKKEWSSFFNIYGDRAEISRIVDNINEIVENNGGWEFCPRSIEKTPPSVSQHKTDITFWILYWPIDLFWYICHDIIVDFANYIYNMFKGMYQKVADSKFKDIKNDFTEKTKGD